MKTLPIVLLLLAGCAMEPATQFRVVWTDDVARSCDAPIITLGRVKGCARWGGQLCTIYAEHPRGEWDDERLETLGHELLHCLEGNWHDKREGMLR